MDVFKSMVVTDNGIHEVDTIQYENVFWLVPSWIEYFDQGKRQPEKIIPLSLIPHRFGIVAGEVQISVPNPIPNELLSPDMPEELIKAYNVVALPEIFFDIQK